MLIINGFVLQLINELEFLIDDTPGSEISPLEVDRYKSVSIIVVRHVRYRRTLFYC